VTLPLLILIALFACLTAAGWGLWASVRLLRRHGIGGVEEDLDLGRQMFGRSAVSAAVLVCTLAGLIWAGELWAVEWRRSAIGFLVLMALALVAGGAVLWAGAYSSHQQWSPKGSHRGMLLGMLAFAISMGLFVLTVRWLGGWA
jgi:hypothetical protein